MDATILLVEERKTPRDDLERACDLLRNSNLLGIILNKSRELPKPDPITWPEAGFFRRIFDPER
jgi:Mrp family chromosome partitioning ATPase